MRLVYVLASFGDIGPLAESTNAKAGNGIVFSFQFSVFSQIFGDLLKTEN